MRKKILSMVLFVVLLLPMYSMSLTIFAANEGEIEASIVAGLDWLAGIQNADGSWPGDEPVARTGLAVLKFIDRAKELGKNPFEEGYQYHMQVEKGLEYIFMNAYTMPITPQPAGDPDTNGNGIGVYFVFDDWHHSYTTGICLMAIGAADACADKLGIPSPIVSFGPLASWTYEDVIQDTVDYLAFGQNDANWERGGWGYRENWIDWSDNSNTGWVTFGLGYALTSGATIPQFVYDELEVWINYIQNPVDGDWEDGGSGYTGPWDWVNMLKTGNLLYQMALVEYPIDDLRVTAAIDYQERNWDNADWDPGWKGGDGWPDWSSHHATFCIMKGFEAFGIDLLDLDYDSVPEFDWFDEMSTRIVETQNPDGSWFNDHWGDEILSTTWALLTLEKVVAITRIPVFVDIKPGSWPNPININSQGLITVAVCGTEAFDVTTIDPVTVELYYGQLGGVPPIRWAYDDVATPYTGGPCSGHDLLGDGYPDLVLKYDNQEIVDTFGLDNVGETVPLTIKGQLHEEYSGTPIVGNDCVLIRKIKFFRIGITSGYDGDYPSVYAIAKIAEKDINEYCEEEDYGFRFEFNLKNNKADPGRLFENMDEFKEENTNLIVGHPWSSQCQLALDYVNENNMIMLSPSSTSHLLAIPDDNLYRLTPPDPLTGMVIGELLDYHLKEAITIIYQDNFYGHGIRDKLVETCDSKGIEVLSIYHYSPPTFPNPWDFSTQLGSINADLQEAVDILGYFDEQLAVVVIGYNGIIDLLDQADNDPTYPKLNDVAWYGSDYMARNQQLLDWVPFVAEIKLYSPSGAMDYDHPKFPEISTEFFDITGRELEFYDATTYDSCWILAESAIVSQADNAHFIKMAMEQLVVDYDGLSGISTFDENGDRIGSDYDIWCYDIDGGVPTIKHYGYYDFETNTITPD